MVLGFSFGYVIKTSNKETDSATITIPYDQYVPSFSYTYDTAIGPTTRDRLPHKVSIPNQNP